MKPSRLYEMLVSSSNEAADDLLLLALQLGDEHEQALALESLIKRENQYGLLGVLNSFDKLTAQSQSVVIKQARTFYFTLSEAGRSASSVARLASMRIIAAARLGKLSYVLSENLRDANDDLSRAACDALLELSRWVNTQSRVMHNYTHPDDEITLLGSQSSANDSTVMSAPTAHGDLASAYAYVMEQRPEIEMAVARALDWSRSKHLPDLLRAALLLCDHPQSKTLAILKSSRHGGQASMVRRLQQPPSADSVEAFLLGASHGHLRTNFAAAFAQIAEKPVLDALLRRTHWLADHQLNTCIGGVSRGVWWGVDSLTEDLERRQASEVTRVVDWIAASGLNDSHQDELFKIILQQSSADPRTRLHVLRRAAIRSLNAPCDIFVALLPDEDERIVRMAVREIVRRRPPDFESLLLKRLATAQGSVRRVISRAISRAGFEQYWNRFDHMDVPIRQAAGRALLRLLDDAQSRLNRYLTGGTIDQRVKAMTIIQELDLAQSVREELERLTEHASPKVRSKAVAVLAGVPDEVGGAVLEKVLVDNDPRVRANAIEVIETCHAEQYIPLLTARTRSSASRERANAIKALHEMNVAAASSHLQLMLRDPRQEHRISALWTLRRIGLWEMVTEVGQIAQKDDDVKVRRYAIGILKSVIESLQKHGHIGGEESSAAAPADQSQQKVA